MKKPVRLVIILLLMLVVLFWFFWRLDSVPSFAYWWDEAWTMNVARNWVETGHFGQILNGEPQSTGLSASFPVVLPVAWSFRLLGVGVWQARLVIAGFAIAALAVLYGLGKGLYSSKVAWAALFIAIWMSPQLLTNPIYMGRQVMAEMPMLFYLLAGYLCFFLSFRNLAWAVPMILCWGLTIITKSQPLPFFVVSLLVPLTVSLFHRQWRGSRAIRGRLVRLVGGLADCYPVVWHLDEWSYPAGGPLKGLLQISALTLDSHSRESAIILVLLTGIPTVISIGYLTWEYWIKLRKQARLTPSELTGLALLVFCGSWLAWYLLLSLGWARYLMPVMFVSSLFVARLFFVLTKGFDLRYIIQSSGYAIRHLRFTWHSIGTIWFILCIVYNVDLTYIQWRQAFLAPSDGVLQTAEYLNTNTSPDALIETYESGVLSLLNRSYHYPPDEISVQILYLRTNANLKLNYDPMPADPDYLVIGRFAREVKLYDTVLETGQFLQIAKIGEYEIYQRRR